MRSWWNRAGRPPALCSLASRQFTPSASSSGLRTVQVCVRLTAARAYSTLSPPSSQYARIHEGAAFQRAHALHLRWSVMESAASQRALFYACALDPLGTALVGRDRKSGLPRAGRRFQRAVNSSLRPFLCATEWGALCSSRQRPATARRRPALPVCVQGCSLCTQGRSPLSLGSPVDSRSHPVLCYARHHEHRGRPPSLGSSVDSTPTPGASPNSLLVMTPRASNAQPEATGPPDTSHEELPAWPRHNYSEFILGTDR
jgi:hypothetical protein